MFKIISCLTTLLSLPLSSWAVDNNIQRRTHTSASSTIDAPYSEQVSRGRTLEQKGKHAEALKEYREASQIKRYELESYYVLLDMGRVQYKMGEYSGAIITLQNYLTNLEIELKVIREEIVPPSGMYVPIYRDAGKALLGDKAEAEALIAASKAMKARMR